MDEIGYIALGIYFFILGYQYAARKKREQLPISPAFRSLIAVTMQFDKKLRNGKVSIDNFHPEYLGGKTGYESEAMLLGRSMDWHKKNFEHLMKDMDDPFYPENPKK